MTNTPPGADYDSRAPWFDKREPIEIEYEPEDDYDSDNEPDHSPGLEDDVIEIY
jgi:hypothetical protein